MIKIYVYNKADGRLEYVDMGNPESVVDSISETMDFTLTPPPLDDGIWCWQVDEWINEWVELLPINNPDIQFNETSVWDAEQEQWIDDEELLAAKKINDQALMWERIKDHRASVMMSGVYVPSIDKTMQTDSISAQQYAFVGIKISRGDYEPINWKALDNSFFVLTESIFYEFQDLFMAKTQTNYIKAEWHKHMMIEADDPLSYDYMTGWI